MIKVDLITGFLGSGKTTFMKKYAEYLIEKGMNIGILENDHGAVNVDMMLLYDLEGEHCELEMIAGGCDRETHRRRFKTKLIAMGMCGYDRVLIEPSGIFDVDEFFDALYEEPLDKWYEIGNVITIVDAGLPEKLDGQGEYLLASEAAEAGCVVLSKCQKYSEEQADAAINHLNRALEQVKCSRRFQDEVLCKDWDTLTDRDFDMLLGCGYRTEAYEKQYFDEKQGFDTLYFMNMEIPGERLAGAAEKILNDSGCGQVSRIKGFVKEGDGWLEVNATHGEITVQPVSAGQAVIIVIGEGMNREQIQLYWEQE